MGSPPLIFQGSFSRRENPSGVTTRLPQSSFFSLAVSLRESRAKTTGTKRKTTPEGWFL